MIYVCTYIRLYVCMYVCMIKCIRVQYIHIYIYIYVCVSSKRRRRDETCTPFSAKESSKFTFKKNSIMPVPNSAQKIILFIGI